MICEVGYEVGCEEVERTAPTPPLTTRWGLPYLSIVYELKGGDYVLFEIIFSRY